MTQNGVGWTVAIGGLGMMAGLMAVEIQNLHQWIEVTTPVFVGKSLLHFSSVVAAFLGGKLIQAKV